MTWLITSAVTNALVVIPLALIAWLVARYSKRPALAHLVWAAVLVKLITPPIITIPLPWQIDPQALLAKLNQAPPATTSVARERVPGHAPAPKLELAAEQAQSKQGAVVRKPSISARKRATAPVEAKPASTWHVTTPLLVLYSLGGIWVLGGVFMATRTLYLAWCFQRSLRKSRSDEFLNIRMGRIAQAAGFTNWPEVVLLDGVFSPMLWGMGRRARLIFPAELAARLDRAASDTLLLHELAHYSRGDHWVRLLELAAKTVFWWHPVVWITLKGIEAAEEECCDAWVIERQHSPRRTYAEALLATIDFLNEQSVALPPVASGLGEISLLRRRLTQIMRNEDTAGLSPAARMTVIVLALLIAPTGPALFASSARGQRTAKPPARVPVRSEQPEPQFVEVNSTASAELVEPLPAETPPTRLPAPRLVPSLTSRSTTPWAPPNLWAAAVSPDGRYKLEARTAGKLTRITLSNVEDGFKVDLSSDGIQCVSFSGDGRFASGHQDGNVRVWDSATGGISMNLKGSDAAISTVAFSRDGSLVAAGTAAGQLLVWDAAPGDDRARDPRYELEQQDAAIGCVRWSELADRLAISVATWNDTEQPELLVWELAADEITHRLPLDRPAGAISWLSGDSVIAANWDGMASIWQLSSGEVATRLELDKNSLSAAAWSPDCPLVPRQRVQGLLEMP